MNILAIDYGEKRIGLALASCGWVKPYGIIKNTNIDNLLEELKIILKKEKVKLLVIGMPKPFAGRENLQTRKVKSFSEKIKQNFNVPLEFESEIFTTKLANNLSEKTRSKKKYLDDKAAAFILENYLLRKNRYNDNSSLA